MVEERFTEVHTPEGRTQSHTTVVRDERRGSGATWLIVLLALLALVVAIWAFSSFSEAEVAKDNAIASAATEVGEAAGQVGGAAQDTAEAVR